MSAIADHFGGKYRRRIPLPPVAADDPPTNGDVMSDAARNAVARFGETFAENERLLAENGNLRNEVMIRDRHIAELQHMLDRAQGNVDRLNRFAASVVAHFATIKNAVVSVEHYAREAMHTKPAAEPAPSAPDQIMEQLHGIVSGLREEGESRPPE